MSITQDSLKKTPRIKYRRGLCLFCDRPVQKTGRLWCLASHMKEHDKQLKVNPIRYGNTICRTANALGLAILHAEAKSQLLQKKRDEAGKITQQMMIQLSTLAPNSPEYKELEDKIILRLAGI